MFSLSKKTAVTVWDFFLPRWSSNKYHLNRLLKRGLALKSHERAVNMHVRYQANVLI